MNTEILRKKLLNQNADFEIIKHDIPIKSKKDAIGYFKIEETVPTLIVKTDIGFFALIVSGERNKVDFNLIKTKLACATIEMADKKEIVDKFKIEPGQIPLIGHNLPTIMDNNIFKYEDVYGGTGDWYYTLKIKPFDLLIANNVVLRFD